MAPVSKKDSKMKKGSKAKSDVRYFETVADSAPGDTPMDKNYEPKFISAKEFLDYFVPSDTPTVTERSPLKLFCDEVEQYNLGLSKYNIVADYLHSSGNCSEILELLGKNQLKVNKPEAVQLFAVLEKILLSIAEELHSFEKMGQIIVKNVLESGMKALNLMLSLKQKSETIKTALKLLTVMVAQGLTSARDVQMGFNFQKEGLSKLLNLRNSKDLQDVRVCFVHFIISFMIAGDNSVVQKLLEEKGFLNAVFPALVNDRASLISLFLTTVKEKVLENPSISKTLKIRVLNDSTLRYVFELLSWKGPRYRIGLKKRKFEKTTDVRFAVEDASEDDVELVQEIASDFLRVACCSHKFGVIFHDYTLGISGKNLNHVLTNLLSFLHQPYCNPRLSELVLELLKACPDQVYPYLRSLQPSLEPRLSVTWFQAMTFINKIIASQEPGKVILTAVEKKTPKLFVELCMRLMCPVFEKNQVVTFMQGNVLEIQHELTNHLVTILEKITQIMNMIEKMVPGNCIYTAGELADFVTELREAVVKVVPDAKAMFDCLNNIPANSLPLDSAGTGLTVITISEHIDKVLHALTTWKKIFSSVDSPISYSGLLELVTKHSSVLSSTQVEKIQLKALQYLTFSEFQACLLTKDNLEKMPVYLLLNMFLNTSDSSVQSEVQKLLASFLKNTVLFRDPGTELSLWLQSLQTLPDEQKRDGVWIFCTALSNLVASPEVYIQLLSQAFEKANGNLMPDNSENITKECINTEVSGASQCFLSPLLSAALSTLGETKRRKRTGAVNYVSRVAREILHRQYEPEVLCYLLHRFANILPSSLTKYAAIWLPSEYSVPESKSDEEIDCQDSLSSTLQNIFMSYRTTGSLRASFSCKSYQIAELSWNEMSSVLHQVLLYVHTELQRVEDGHGTDSVVTFLCIIDNLLQQVETSSSKNSATELQEHLLLHFFVKIVLIHPSLIKWFLARDSAPKSSKSIRKCVNIVTPFVSKFLDLAIAKLKNNDAEQFVMPYKNKVMCVLCDSFLNEDCEEWWLKMITFFSVVHRYLTRDELTAVLDCILIPDVLSLDSIQFAMKFVDSQLEKFCACAVGDKKNKLSTEAIQVLVVLVSELEKDRLETDIAGKLLFLLDHNSLYCFTLDIDRVASLLQYVSAPRIKLVACLAQNSSSHRHALRQWLQENYGLLTEWPPALIIELISRALTFRKSDPLLPVVSDVLWHALCSYLIGGQQQEMDKEIDIQKVFQILLKGKHVDVNALEAVATEILDQAQKHEFVPSNSILSVIAQLFEYLGKVSIPVGEVGARSAFLQILVLSVSSFVDGKKEPNKTYFLDFLSQVSNFIEDIDDESVYNAFSENRPWAAFIKSSLKHSLQCATTGSHLLSLTANLCKGLYKSNNNDVHVEPSANDVYQLIFGHSNFLPILLGELGDAKIKESLIDLMLSLVSVDASVCKTEHFPILLGAYQPTFASVDQKLLYLMKHYEERDADMFQFRPFLWGPAAVSHYTVKKTAGFALWKHPKMENVLSMLDEDKLEKTALIFPLDLKLQPQPNVETTATDIYDPRFLFPLFAHLLEPGCFVNCKKFLESRCLGVVFASLASNDSDMRALGYYLLSQFYQHLEGSLYRERFIWLGLLDSVKNAIEVKNQCLSSLVTVFLARVTKLFFTPHDPLYVPIYHFLTIKPCLDLLNVPEFYKLFYSDHIQYKHHREWILTLIADGLRKSLDFHICQKRYVFNILLTFYNSSVCIHHYKVLILRILKAVSRIPNSACVMCQRHGLLAWMRSVVTEESNEEIIDHIISIMHTLWETSCVWKMDRTDSSAKVRVNGESTNKPDPESSSKLKEKNPFYSGFSLEFLLNCFAILEKICNTPTTKCLPQYLDMLHKCLSNIESTNRRQSFLALRHERHLLRLFEMLSGDGKASSQCTTKNIENVVKILLLWHPKQSKETFSDEQCGCLLSAMEIVLKHHTFDRNRSLAVAAWLNQWLKEDRNFALATKLLEDKDSRCDTWNLMLKLLVTISKMPSSHCRKRTDLDRSQLGNKILGDYVSSIMSITTAVRDKNVREKRVRKLLRSREYEKLLENEKLAVALHHQSEGNAISNEDMTVVATFLLELWAKKDTPNLTQFLIQM